MAETTIAWADYTFNPWWGCVRVSPGWGWELAPCGATLAGGLCAGSKRPASAIAEEPAA